MGAKMKLAVNVPEELLFAAGIDENTVFECYFEDGAIHISSLTDEEVAEISRENISVTENDDTDDLADCEECENFCKHLRTCMCGMIDEDDDDN